MKKNFKLFITIILIPILLIGCSNNSSDNPDPSDSDLSGHLVIYTSESQDLATEIIEEFVSLHPKVTYELFRSGTGDVITRLDTELQTGSTPANIIWMADIGYVYGLEQRDLIHHYSPENAADVDDAYKYGDGMAHEIRLIYNVLAYNTTRVTEPPTDWYDVAQSRFESVFAMANPNYSGGAFTNLVVHIQNSDLVGWDFYDAIRDNDVKYEQSNGNLQTKVSSGEYSVVAIVDFMARNATNEGSPVETIWPESGAVLVPTPIALLNTLDDSNREAAEAFVNFTMSLEAQAFFVDQGYIPVRKEAGSPEGAPSLSEIKVLPFDLDFYIENSSNIRTEYEARYGA